MYSTPSPTFHGVGLQDSYEDQLPSSQTFDNDFVLKSRIIPEQKSCPPAPMKSRKKRVLGSPINDHSERTPERRTLFSEPEPASTDYSRFSQEYEILGVIGSGSFSQVYKTVRREDGQFCAVKKLMRPYRGEKDRERALQEVIAMRAVLGHPHCIELYDAWEEGDYLFIVSELCTTGTLKSYLDQHTMLKESKVWEFLFDMTCGLKHIHDCGLIHLDIKPSNILIADDGILKIGDFGLAMHQGVWSDGREGDSCYMAPELLAPDAHLQVGPAADIFSLGMTVLEMTCKIVVPSSGRGWQRLRSGESFVSDVYSEDLRSLVMCMMHPEPHKRPTAQQLLDVSRMKEVTSMRMAALSSSGRSWTSITQYTPTSASRDPPSMLTKNLSLHRTPPPDSFSKRMMVEQDDQPMPDFNAAL